MYPDIHPYVNESVIFYYPCIERESQPSQRRESTQSRNTRDEEQGANTFEPAPHFGLNEI